MYTLEFTAGDVSYPKSSVIFWVFVTVFCLEMSMNILCDPLAHLCLLQAGVWSVCLQDDGDKVVVVQDVLDLVLRVQDGTT